jgi:cytochrome c553
MMRGIGLGVAIAISCHRPTGAPGFPELDELGTQHAERPVEEALTGEPLPHDVDRVALRSRMRQQLQDLRRIEEKLVDGRLEEARTLAFLLTRSTQAPELASWSKDTAELATHAYALSRAVRLGDAARASARLSEACAGCHERVGAQLRFAPPRPPPAGPADRCSPRHRWAVDRMLEGLVGGEDGPWRAGLEVFASTRVTAPIDAAGRELHQLARAGVEALPLSTRTERATTYGAMLTTCGECHAATPRVRDGR